jgi:UDP-N-acetylmuramate dehydrogenase
MGERIPEQMGEAAFEAKLCEIVGAGAVAHNAPLAPFTTFRIGGPADWLVQTRSAAQIVAVLGLAHEAGVPVTMLGGGSNVLIADSGIRGVVVRPRGGTIDAGNQGGVEADASVTLNGLVRWTIGRGLAGLEAWAGTPGTVGGAVWGNAHYGGRLIGDLVRHVLVASRDGSTAEVTRDGMEFGYDRSRLQRTAEVALRVGFGLGPGADPSVLRAVARQSLAHRKLTQPLHLPTAGCIFQNPGPDEVLPPDVPRSAGALVDRAGLKGHRIGGAQVSPVHANFIVNDRGATAADVRSLAELCRQRVRDRFGVTLGLEIVCLGT